MAAVLAFVLLSGCTSLIDNMYDDAAREECDRSARDRGGCYDRVEQQRRERDRQN
jgi:hypothetical protein